MKKILCIILSVLLILSLASCNYSKSVKRISVEETENHFNEYVEDIANCMEKYDIKGDYEYSFEDDSGYILFSNEYLTLSISLYNDRFNPFGEDFELGYEKYRVHYQTSISEADDMLDTDNPAFKIIPVALSNITGTTVTEEEVKEYFEEIKENTKVPHINSDEEQDDIIEIDSDFKDMHMSYSLSYVKGITWFFSEVIVFGGEGYNNYTNVE